VYNLVNPGNRGCKEPEWRQAQKAGGGEQPQEGRAGGSKKGGQAWLQSYRRAIEDTNRAAKSFLKMRCLMPTPPEFAKFALSTKTMW